ncbi:MAG: energy transducer TonB [Prevotella sp.]|jgi:protein TonB|nr:energy transducer TonB [Prevotella sp.]MBQ6422796.1 energy transducer TonB [Prevotella sp.]MDY6439210.1 energy transducer TonB [Prevotella sp.]
MAKIDLIDPKWVDMVFANKNKAYGAYQLRKGTSGRNIKSIIILVVAASIVGGFLAWKVHADKVEQERIARMEAMELSKLQEQAKKEKKEDKPKVQPKIEPKKEIPEVRESQKFTAPVIKKDELVKEENQVKQMDQLKKDVAVSNVDQEGTKDRTVEAVRNDIAVNVPPPPVEAPKQEVKQEVENKVFTVAEQMPSFKGNVNQWLSQNLTYPAVAAENGIEGRVIVKFVVEKDGRVTDVQVVRSVDPALDREAVNTVKRMPKWNPGMNNGQPARVWFTLPVNFKLQ